MLVNDYFSISKLEDALFNALHNDATSTAFVNNMKLSSLLCMPIKYVKFTYSI